MKTIQVQIKNNYGNEAIYPVCDTGKIFLELTGTKTLSRHQIAIIKSLGYTVEVQQQTL